MNVLRNKNNPFKHESFLKYNSSDSNKIFKPRKKLTKNIFSLEQAPEAATPQQPAPEAEQEQPQPPAGPIPQQEVGYLSISTFTASGALPVADVLITIYTLDEAGEENVLGVYTSDANGQVPLITLPVTYNRLDPFESSQYFFSTITYPL